MCNSASTKSFGREKDVSGGGGVVQLGSEFFRFILKRKTPLNMHMLEVQCVHGDYHVDALQVYLAFRAAALNLYATLPLW